jgi:hypothetical protein
MRGSRMRDRRPPAYLWNCGTRAAKLQPATGDPDGVQHSLHLFRTYCPTSPAAARPRSGPLTTALARHVRPSAITSTSSSSGRFIVVLILPLPGRSVPCDVRNLSPSGHKCLLRRTQISGVGRGSLPASRLTSGFAANAGSLPAAGTDPRRRGCAECSDQPGPVPQTPVPSDRGSFVTQRGSRGRIRWTLCL